jgi:hypothetical protein
MLGRWGNPEQCSHDELLGDDCSDTPVHEDGQCHACSMGGKGLAGEGWSSRLREFRYRRLMAALAVGVGLAGCPSTSPLGTDTTARPSRTTMTPPSATTTAVPINSSARLTTSSAMLTAGADVTIAGTECPPGDEGNATLSQTINDLPFTARFVPVAGTRIAGTDGSWTMAATVPIMLRGTAMLQSVCGPTRPGVGGLTFRYPTVEVTVTNPARLVVLPATTVTAGTTLTISAVGGGCPNESMPEVLSSDPSGASPFVRGNPTVGPQGVLSWPVTLLIPPGSRPGQYDLSRDCSIQEQLVVGMYEPLTITVE